ncbi:C25 family cysteine peptidase [Chitinophaga sp. 30R24]|uniref:C25 family cysteine peptidase n=1 Tax=Chitinophaga sp. 30R24 TaxID=3248838 RepID=UPI003B9128D8
MLTTKLIVTNKTALQGKYGDSIQLILNALHQLQAHDNGRQLDTHVIFIDDATQMQACGAAVVTDAADEAQQKKAIDDLYRYYIPGYLLLLGSQDIIPFQRLKNLLPGDNDPDTYIPSDLPYACDAPYDTDPGKFISPTRVVGRLPDIPGVADASYLHTLISNIIAASPAPPSEYLPYFSISTYDWQDSTQNSLQHIFGNHHALQVFPGDDTLTGSNWTAEQLQPKTHFINCHGAIYNPGFYGQKATDFPLALRSDVINNKITPGTLVAAECCYGGQLFDPQKNSGRRMSIANSYLLNHALCFIGSSNIAYGPPTGQGLADLLTQYFIINVLNGASTGRALLEARQRFLNEMGPTLDPYELKTAAQFYLLGDPSWQPVVNTQDPSATSEKMPFVNTLQNRRDNLEARGKMLDDFISVPHPSEDTYNINSELHVAIHQLLDERKFAQKRIPKVFVNKKNKATYQEQGPPSRSSVKFHVFSESISHGEIPLTKVIVVKEKNNQILGYREYVSR